MSANAVQQLTPEAVFGALICRECGFSTARIAARLSVPDAELEQAIAAAESGTFERVRSADDARAGAGSPYERSQYVGEGAIDEVFRVRWQRNVLRLMDRCNGTVAVARVCSIRAAYPNRDGISLDDLHNAMRAQRFKWDIEIIGNKAFYVLTEGSLDSLRALIAHRWVPVARAK